MGYYNLSIPRLSAENGSPSLGRVEKYFVKKLNQIESKIGKDSTFQELLNVYMSKLKSYPQQTAGILLSLKTVINQILEGKYYKKELKRDNKTAVKPERSSLNVSLPSPEQIIETSATLKVCVTDDKDLIAKYMNIDNESNANISNSLEDASVLNEEDKKSEINQTMDISEVEEKDVENITETDLKLEKYEQILEKIEDKIKFYEEQEIEDLESEDTPYLRLEVLKKQFLKVWKQYSKLCDSEFNPDKAIRWKKLRINHSNSEEINSAISLLVNKERQFPDYNDIYEIVKRLSKGTKLEDEAKDLFKRVCADLKKRRFHYYQQDFGCHLTDEVDIEKDPAMEDKDLAKQLDENEKLYQNKTETLIEEFSKKQDNEDIDKTNTSDAEESHDKSEDISVDSDDSFEESENESDFIELDKTVENKSLDKSNKL